MAVVKYKLSHSAMIDGKLCPRKLHSKRFRRTGNKATPIHLLNTIVGHASHETIEFFIEDWKAQNSLPILDQLEKKIHSIIEEIWKDPRGKILEIKHAQGPPEEEWTSYRNHQLKNASNVLITFIRVWNQLDMQSMKYVEHEEYRSVTVPGTNHVIGGIFDLYVMTSSGKHLIIDWKSGYAPQTYVGDGQLGIYAYILHHGEQIPINEIECAFVSLKNGSNRILQPTDLDLGNVEIRIQDSISLLEETDIEELPPEEFPSLRSCINCGALNDCPSGQRFLRQTYPNHFSDSTMGVI